MICESPRFVSSRPEPNTAFNAPHFIQPLKEALLTVDKNFPAPRRGRYAHDPARADENGIIYVPPPVTSAWPKIAAAAGIAAAVVLAARKLRGDQPEKRDRNPGRAA